MRPDAPESRRTVVVVDDDPGTRAVLQIALEDEGFTVEIAGDGLTALRKVRGEPPDAIVLDLNMPRMGGEDFLYAWRAGVETLGVPVVVITASSTALRPTDLGVHAVFPKPFDLAKLVDAVADLVDAPSRHPDATRAAARVTELRELVESITQVMGMVLGTAEVLADDPPDPDERRALATRVLESAQRGSALTRHLHRVVSTLE